MLNKNIKKVIKEILEKGKNIDVSNPKSLEEVELVSQLRDKFSKTIGSQIDQKDFIKNKLGKKPKTKKEAFKKLVDEVEGEYSTPIKRKQKTAAKQTMSVPKEVSDKRKDAWKELTNEALQQEQDYLEESIATILSNPNIPMSEALDRVDEFLATEPEFGSIGRTLRTAEDSNIDQDISDLVNYSERAGKATSNAKIDRRTNELLNKNWLNSMEKYRTKENAREALLEASKKEDYKKLSEIYNNLDAKQKDAMADYIKENWSDDRKAAFARSVTGKTFDNKKGSFKKIVNEEKSDVNLSDLEKSDLEKRNAMLDAVNLDEEKVFNDDGGELMNVEGVSQNAAIMNEILHDLRTGDNPRFQGAEELLSGDLDIDKASDTLKERAKILAEVQAEDEIKARPAMTEDSEPSLLELRHKSQLRNLYNKPRNLDNDPTGLQAVLENENLRDRQHRESIRANKAFSDPKYDEELYEQGVFDRDLIKEIKALESQKNSMDPRDFDDEMDRLIDEYVSREERIRKDYGAIDNMTAHDDPRQFADVEKDGAEEYIDQLFQDKASKSSRSMNDEERDQVALAVLAKNNPELLNRISSEPYRKQSLRNTKERMSDIMQKRIDDAMNREVKYRGIAPREQGMADLVADAILAEPAKHVDRISKNNPEFVETYKAMSPEKKAAMIEAFTPERKAMLSETDPVKLMMQPRPQVPEKDFSKERIEQVLERAIKDSSGRVRVYQQPKGAQRNYIIVDGKPFFLDYLFRDI